MNRKSLTVSSVLSSVLMSALSLGLPIAGCAPVTQVAVAPKDISADVYKLLLKELFAELSISSEAQDIKTLKGQLDAQTPDEKYLTLKKLTQRSAQLYTRLSDKLKSLNPPAEVKAVHEQSVNLRAALRSSNEQLERALASDRNALIKSLTEQPAQAEASLSGALQSYLKPESKATILNLGKLGITYQASEPVISALSVSQFWEKADADLSKASDASAKTARNQMLVLLQASAGSPVASVKVDTLVEAQLIQAIEDNAKALNAKNLQTYQDSLHPSSPLMGAMPSLFHSLVQAQLSYQLKSFKLETATETEATMLVQRTSSSVNGTSDDSILYHLRKGSQGWKLFHMDVKTSKNQF